ncbi:MAG TPA: phage holin family protein [Egibacteraceae bacterium]|nr:phage holin family protein [Egibacteraceae bacterium]
MSAPSGRLPRLPKANTSASSGRPAGPPPSAAPPAGPPPSGDDDQSLSELLSTLLNQLSTLFRKEIELAQTEIKQEVRRAGKAAGALGGAGGAGYMAAVMLSFALAFALGEFLPVWVGFLVVGVIYAVVAGVLFRQGKEKLDRVNPKPEQTIETLKEDAEWIKNRRS